MAVTVDIAGRIAERVNPELEFLAKLGIGIQFPDEVDEAEDAGGFIAVNAGEDADFDPGLDGLGPLKDEAGQPKAILSGAPEAEGIRPQSIRRPNLDEERKEDFFDRPGHGRNYEG